MATVNSSNTTTLYSTTQTTPVQTGADIPQGQVNDTNFTTLYANTQGNATGGGVSGNLLVRGDLRVLGSSDLEGPVTISNSYIMPTTDGTNLQVLSTDGNGNATWQNISAVAGYAIQADTATGGADLTLTQVGNPVDSVKFAGGTNITVSRTDANTITISTIADDIPNGTAQGQVLYWNGTAWTASSNITSAAANDRLVVQYDNSTAGTNAALFLRKNYGATAYTTNDGVGAAFQLDSDSQTLNQIATINALWKGSPSATEITLNTNSLNNTTGPFIAAATFAVAQATLPGDLAVNGGDITTTNVTGNLFNTNAVVVNIGDGATTEVNLGNTSSGRVQIKPNTIVGANTTQNVFNTVATTVNAFGDATAVNIGVDGAVAGAGTTTIRSATTVVKGDLQVNGDNTGASADITTTKTTASVFNTTATTVNAFGAASTLNVGANTGTMTIGNPTVVGTQATQNLYNTTATTVNAFGAATAVNIGAATGTTTIGHNLSINGTELKINADGAGSPADTFVYFNGTNESLKWNQTDSRFEFSDQLYISQTDMPAVFERRVTTADVNPNEPKGAVRLLERVTDAASNATDDAGPAVVFGRSFGSSGGTEKIFAGMGSVWYGTNNKAALQFNWSTDDFTEPTPGVFPQTYTLLTLGSDQAKFFNNSVYIDYAYVDSTDTATSITGGNTLVFGSAHGYSAGDRILYQSATQNGLTQSTYYYVLATGLTSTQCRVSTIAGGTAATLTNGTGLTLTFATVSNRVGINTTTPSQVLDVNGNANVSGIVTVQGDAVTINSDKTDTDVYLNFGRVAPGNNAAIRWNATTDSFEWSADSTTWYDFIDVVITSPQQGQSIIYNGTNWENSNEFEFVNFAYRSSFINNVSTAGSIVSAEFLKRRTSLVNGNSSGQLLGQIVGTTETYTHRLVSQYDTTGNNEYLIQIDPVGNFAPGSTTITTQLAVDNDSLRLSATDITLNLNGTTSAGVDAGLTIERGTSGADATFKWIESNTRFEANASIYSLGNLIADGPNIQVNADSTAADSFLYMKGTSEYLKWNNTDTRFEFNDDLEVVGNVNATSYNIDDTRARIDTGNSAAWAAGANIALTTTDKNLQKVMFYITDGTNVHALEALALRTGTGAGDTKLTTYGEMYSSTPLASFTAEISAGALRIRGTNLTATTLTVSILSSTLL